MSSFVPVRYIASRSVSREVTICDMLSHVPLFRDLLPDNISKFSSPVQIVSYSRRTSNKSIFLPGDESKTFYVLLSGVVAYFRYTNNNIADSLISIIPPNGFFGEASFLEKSYSYGAYALTDIQVALFCPQDILELFKIRNDISERYIVLLEKMYREANQRFINMSLQDVTGRLATLLLMFARDFSVVEPDGLRLITKLTNQEFASLIGATRETVNRNLNRLWDQKVIDMSGSNILVRNITALETLANRDRPRKANRLLRQKS